MGDARDKFRTEVAEALTGWRLGTIPPRANWGAEQEIIRAGIAEIVALRLVAAYNPIFLTLQRIENQLALFVAIRDDPYAPPPRTPDGSCARPRLIETRRRSGP